MEKMGVREKEKKVGPRTVSVWIGRLTAGVIAGLCDNKQKCR